MTVKPLARRATSPTRGRHLLATDRIQKGQLIFCERPLVALQSIGNVHEGVLVCQYCMSFCGTPAQALRVAADPTQLQEITTQTPSSEQTTGDHALIPCRHKCGHIYCSLECQQDDWEWGGHKELCTGWIDDDNAADHPLIEFRRHAIQSNEIFLLIAKWLARIQNQNLPYYHEDDASPDAHPMLDFSMKLWWDVATLPLANDPMGFADMLLLDQSCRQLCEESHALLEAAWPEHKDTSPWLTPMGMARLIGSLEQNCMGVRRKHPLRYNIMEDTELRNSYHNQLIKCLEKAGMIGDDDGDDACCADDDDEEGDEGKPEVLEANLTPDEDVVTNEATDVVEPVGEEGDEEWDYTPDDIAQFLAGLESPMNIGSDDDWDAILTPLDGTAHFGFTEKMNHSCEPNVVVLYKSRGWGKNHPLVCHCMALRDIEPEEELTIAYVETKEPYDVRQKALANYGFVCLCPKCQREQIASKGKSQDGELTETQADAKGNGAEDEYLFGSDEQDDGSDAGMEPTPDNDEQDDNGEAGEDDRLDGDTKLKDAVEQMESIWNKSNHATIPLQYLAPAANYVVKLATLLINNPGPLQDEKDRIVLDLLQQCFNGARERDFSLCRIVGPDLEHHLYRTLRSTGSFPSPEFREAYWCACCTATIGLSQEGSFLLALQNLDKATILGLKREDLGDFFPYVEMFASQMSATPCPHAIRCQVVDFQGAEIRSELLSEGLSSAISFPVREISCDPSAFGDLAKGQSDPIVLRGLAKNWPATTKWRNMESLSHAYGHRLVPIEVGSMGTGMNEQLVTFREFVSSYLSISAEKSCWRLQDAIDPSSKIAYLAQHPFLEQIPQLYQDVERNPCGVDPTNINAWIGTGGTRTPLHYDSDDNLLIQLVGAKYVRLYDRKETPRLYVSKDKGYGLQGNMSELNCEMEDYDGKHPLARDAKFTEVLLLPGDCLYIPSRHWHYVRSLSTSVSVNYWF